MDKHRWFKRLAAPNLNWQLLQTFMDVADIGSFRQTAMDRFAALNTVRGRVAELERLTGRQLVVRGQGGVTLTPDGEAVLSVARAMAGAKQVVVEAMIREGPLKLQAGQGSEPPADAILEQRRQA